MCRIAYDGGHLYEKGVFVQIRSIGKVPPKKIHTRIGPKWNQKGPYMGPEYGFKMGPLWVHLFTPKKCIHEQSVEAVQYCE
jgi:hypothetical protein